MKGDDAMERTMNDMNISTEGALNGISLENDFVVSITLCEGVGYHKFLIRGRGSGVLYPNPIKVEMSFFF